MWSCGGRVTKKTQWGDASGFGVTGIFANIISPVCLCWFGNKQQTTTFSHVSSISYSSPLLKLVSILFDTLSGFCYLMLATQWDPKVFQVLDQSILWMSFGDQ